MLHVLTPSFPTRRAADLTLAPLDDPRLAGFVARLDDINALADRSPGFVWRLQGDSGNATDIQVADDPNFIVNMSVWKDLDSLFAYVYRSDQDRKSTRLNTSH